MVLIVTVSCMAPGFVSANSVTSYNTVVAANTGTILTEGSEWGGADIYTDAPSQARPTTTGEVVIEYKLQNASRFLLRTAQNAGFAAPVLSIEASYDGVNYQPINAVTEAFDPYTVTNGWSIQKINYSFESQEQTIKSIRITRIAMDLDWYFSIADLQYELVTYTYNTTVAANAGTILTEGSEWGGADIYTGAPAQARPTTTGEVVIEYKLHNASRFLLRTAQNAGFATPVLTIEASYDGENYQPINTVVDAFEPYTVTNGWSIQKINYSFESQEQTIKSIRITRSVMDSDWYFSIADLQYESVPYTYNTTVAANAGTILTENAAWMMSDFYKDVDPTQQFGITMNDPVTFVYNNLNISRFAFVTAQHNNIPEVLSFEVSYDGRSYEAVDVKADLIETYTSGAGYPAKKIDYSFDAINKVIKSIRVTKAQSHSIWYFAAVSLKYEAVPRVYDVAVSPDKGEILTGGFTWSEVGTGYYPDEMAWVITDSENAVTVQYDNVCATEFMVRATELQGLAVPLLSFEVSYDGTNFVPVNVERVALGQVQSFGPLNVVNYISPVFDTPVKSVRFTRQTCYGDVYQRFTMVDLQYNLPIRANEYTIADNLVKGVTSDTCVADFLADFDCIYDTAVVDKNQNVIGDTGLVGTGMVLKCVSGENTVLEYTILVDSDINGDGSFTADDITEIRKALLDCVTFDKAQNLVADMNGDGKVSILDFISIKKKL